ncbi:MAG: hypothetical protein RJA24_229 [Pseudomonadota bacterium]|jgi:uncharacterized membrane protein YhaH (DUF805 family)
MPDRQRLLSALIALVYLTAMGRREGWPGALALLIPLALPLGMIWYAGSLSRIKIRGWARIRIDQPTPPAAIRFLGWMLLLIPALIMTVQRLRAI